MRMKRSLSVLLLTIIAVSIIGTGYFAVPVTAAVDSPKSADYPTLNQDSITDPTGQNVKESHKLEMQRSVTVDVLNPIDWSLNVFDLGTINARIPVNLDLQLAMTFPLNAETSYNPYDVHNGTVFPYVVNLDNDGCVPYATVGIDFSMDLSALDFDFSGLGKLVHFSADWSKIEYKNSWDIPFYGVYTDVGNWISYDIIDKYYSLDDLLSVSLSDYGVSGGIGVNVKYSLYSYVTAKASVDNGTATTSQTLRWDSLGPKTLNIAVDPSAKFGDIYTVEVGDFVYHIAQDVTFTVWADINLEVVGVNLIDQTLDYSYTLNLGELTFPEKDDYTFSSDIMVLAGTSAKNVEATWSPFYFNWDASGGELSLADYTVDIPGNEELQKWFSDMNVDFGIAASVDVDFPFDMVSYYNPGKVTPGSTFDYHVLVDSEDSTPPNVNYNVKVKLDLSSVSIMGYNLGTYDLGTSGQIFGASDFDKPFKTPFGTEIAEKEVTNLLGLDKLSGMLNDYISSALYGVNPDIQLRAWIVLQLEGYMTGTAVITSSASGTPTIVGATEFRWDDQFDTNTIRISIPSTMNAGDSFTITYTNLVYHLKVTPGLKLGISVLGGIVGYDYTFYIKGTSEYLQKDFNAPDFSESITVNSLNVDAYGMSINDPNVPVGDYSASGTFTLKNLGTLTDSYHVVPVTDGLPAGSSITGYSAYISSVSPGSTVSIPFTVNLGTGAHGSEYRKNTFAFKVYSDSDPSVFDIITGELTIAPDPSLVDTEVTAESSLTVTPGTAVTVPVYIENTGEVSLDYQISVSGSYTSAVSSATLSLNPGESTTWNFLVDVPADPSSAAGNYTATVTVKMVGTSVPDITRNVIFTIPEFSLVKTELTSADDSVKVGNDAFYAFRLTNYGNTATDVTVNVTGIDDYTVNGLPGPGTINLLSNDTDSVLIKFAADSLTPGYHTFTVMITENGDAIYSQKFGIDVKQVDVSVYPVGGNYTYVDSPLTYKIDVHNNGETDTFALEILGLDQSAYTLDSRASELTLPTGQSAVLDLIINPTDMRKVRGGENGIVVVIKSSRYGYSDKAGASGVIMPAVYRFVVDQNKVKGIQTDVYYDMIITIENMGNVLEFFTVKVTGIGNSNYTLLGDCIYKDKIRVPHGATVNFTVRILKSEQGYFRPQVSIINSKNEVIATVVGEYWNGYVYSPMFMWTMIGIGAAVAVAISLYTLYTRGIIGAGTSLGERFASVKAAISAKRAVRKTKVRPKSGKGKVKYEDLDKIKIKTPLKERLGGTLEKLKSAAKKKDVDESIWESDNVEWDDGFGFDE